MPISKLTIMLCNFDKLDFKKYHPGGTLSTKLKTVSDLMIEGNKIPFVKKINPDLELYVTQKTIVKDDKD